MEGGETLRAVLVHEAGGPEKLSYEYAPDPRPGPGELLVEVAAAGVNFIDTYQRGGLYPMQFPFIPGQEGAGTVREVGDGVDGFSTGDRVAWAQHLGSYAELEALPARVAVRVPETVDLETAAAVILQGLTAHYLVTDTYPLKRGDVCLIHAGAGGVGLLLTQMAARAGARVITTVGTQEKVATSRAAGADDVVVYEEVDFKEAVEGVVGANQVDVVYDGVGAATFEGSIDLLRPRGMMVSFGNASGAVPPVAPLTLMRKGSIFLTRPTLGDYVRSREELERRAAELFSWVASGDLTVTVGEKRPLSEAAEAHGALEGRRTTGKVLLVL